MTIFVRARTRLGAILHEHVVDGALLETNVGTNEVTLVVDPAAAPPVDPPPPPPPAPEPPAPEPPAPEPPAPEPPPPPAPEPPPPPPPAPEPPPPVEPGPVVLHIVRLASSGPMMSSVSPVNRNELGTYNRKDTLAMFLQRSVAWRWQFASGQVPATLPRCRLMIDNAPATDWQDADGPTGAYTFNTTLENGHHLAHVEGEGFSVRCMAVACVVNDTGAPLPEQRPWSVVNRFEHDRGIANVAVQFQYAGIPGPRTRPLKPREVLQSSDLVGKDQWWCTHQTANHGSLITRRWALTPLGDVVIEHDQKYFHGNAITAPGDTKAPLPSVTLRDGPRGVGTLGYVADMIVRPPGKGVYIMETTGGGRIALLKDDGTVVTEMGWRVKPGHLKVHGDVLSDLYMYRGKPEHAAHLAAYAAQMERVHDTSQLSGPADLFESWGMATAMRGPEGEIITDDGHEFWPADTRNDRIPYADHWTAHSLEGFQPAHFPPPWYVQAPGPTGKTTVCDFLWNNPAVKGPWKTRVRKSDRKLYWTNFDGNSIARCDLDASNVEVILSCALQPTDAQLGVPARLENGRDPIQLRSLVVDGAPGTATCIRPTAFEFDENDDLVFIEHYTYAVRRLDLSTMQVTTLAYGLDVNGGSASSGNNEPNLAIDVRGTVGPVGDIFTMAWGNNSDRRFDRNGVERRKELGPNWRQPFFQSGKKAGNGPWSECDGPNYAWGIGVGHGQIMVQGNASGNQFVRLTRKLPTDPAFNHTKWASGKSIWDATGLLPVICGPNGQGELGFPTYEEMSKWADADLAAFLAGYGVPLFAMEDAMYFVRWNGVDHE